MIDQSKTALGIRVARLVLSLLVVAGCSVWLASWARVSAQGKCQADGHPDVGPCDPEQGYVWDAVCYDDDGCYPKIEDCCEM